MLGKKIRYIYTWKSRGPPPRGGTPSKHNTVRRRVLQTCMSERRSAEGVAVDASLTLARGIAAVCHSSSTALAAPAQSTASPRQPAVESTR